MIEAQLMAQKKYGSNCLVESFSLDEKVSK
jgi:hypothetical protein